MRRILAVFFAFVALISCAHADYDLSGLSDDDLVVLSRNLQSEITTRAIEKADVLYRVACDDWEIIIYNDAYIDENIGRQLVVIHYAFVNYGTTMKNYKDTAAIIGFQNGTGISQDSQIVDWNGTTFRTYVKDGGMVDLYIGFNLNDFSAPFELSIYNASRYYDAEPLAKLMLTAPQQSK